MNETAQQLYTDALRLPDAERAELDSRTAKTMSWPVR